uniref:Uncharacterized protein n=1 Tax=Oryza brachyantha TaxID=4533 RepID=J3N872_ORYBR
MASSFVADDFVRRSGADAPDGQVHHPPGHEAPPHHLPRRRRRPGSVAEAVDRLHHQPVERLRAGVRVPLDAPRSRPEPAVQDPPCHLLPPHRPVRA